MLSRGGGAVAFQKVVSKVSDLPSPLDAEPGTRIIVRETEEVYGLNKTTRMWEVIGTLKKVGGKRPEELAAHLDSEGNPHGTTLQGVLDAGATAKVKGEILITGKGAAQLRLLAGASALRYGADAGSKEGALWLNVGVGAKTILRAVNADGDDMLVLSTDGIVSGGSATFHGGFKGLAEFEDEIVANEGVQSAAGHDLVLSGDKGVSLVIGGAQKVYLDANRLNIGAGLGVKGDLILEGAVRSSLNPAPSLKTLTLGVAQAPWKSAAVGHINAGTLALQVPANSQVAPLKVSGAVPGDTAVLTAGGALGLGTDDPQARLDVRGDALIGSLKLSSGGISSAGWSVAFGDSLVISHKGKVALKGGPDGVTLANGAKVDGDLVVSGKLALGGVSGLHGQEITFGAKATTYKASAHAFEGPLSVKALGPRVLEVPGFAVDSGDLLGEGSLKGWRSAEFKEGVAVGHSLYTNGKIAHPGEFEVDAQTLVAKNLRLLGSPKIEVLNTLQLQGAGGSALFSLGGPTCGVLFEGKRWELLGISHLESDKVKATSVETSGPAKFCGGAVQLTKQAATFQGPLSIGGLAFKKVTEELELTGESTRTKFELPAGVRVEAVLVQLKTDVGGARFLQVGDVADPDRFASPTTDLKAGALIRGLAHWERGRAVQKTKGPVVVSADAAASGKVLVTVHYVDPAAL